MRRSSTTPRLPDSTTRSTRPNATPLANDCTMATPATSCATPWCVWPPTMTSTAPGGSARAAWKISSSAPHDSSTFGSSKSRHLPPAWAATSTTWAPRRRRSAASSAIVSASGFMARPAKLLAMVVCGVDSVVTPMMPMRTPARSIRVVGEKFGHATRFPVDESSRFAARNGYFASAARALSAPRGSSPGIARHRALAGGAEVELVVADRDRRVAEVVVGLDDGLALVEVRLERALEHVAAVDHDDVVHAARRAQAGHVAGQLRQRLDVPVQIAGADDGEGDLARRRRRLGARGAGALGGRGPAAGRGYGQDGGGEDRG